MFSMKLKLFQIILLSLLIITTKEMYSQETVFIHGKVIHPKSNVVNISAPTNNVTSWAITKKMALNKDGHFSFIQEASKPGFYEISYETAPFNYISVKLLLSAGDSCFVVLDTETQSANISCNNNQYGLELFNELNRQIQELETNAVNKFRKYNSYEINDTIIKSRDSILKQLHDLSSNGNTKQNFLNTLAKEITYRYASLYYDLIRNIVFMSEEVRENHPKYLKQSRESLLFADSTLTQLFYTFESIPNNSVEPNNQLKLSAEPVNSELVFSNSYLKFLEKYIYYRGYYLPQREKTFDLKMVDNNFHKYNLNLYALHLIDKEFEYGVGSYFYTWFQKPNMAEELLKPYNRFKMYYPENPFIPYIDSIAEEYKLFKNMSITNFADNVNFIAGADNINSLEELLGNFNGQNLYIDIWATTCPPCLKEFAYYSDLYRFLSLNDISILYISLDKTSEMEHWKKTINKYNLIGYHILANKKLEADIKAKTKMFGLPWYCIKDRNGNLSKEFIFRPSSKENLHEQINSYINE